MECLSFWLFSLCLLSANVKWLGTVGIPLNMGMTVLLLLITYFPEKTLTGIPSFFSSGPPKPWIVLIMPFCLTLLYYSVHMTGCYRFILTPQVLAAQGIGIVLLNSTYIPGEKEMIYFNFTVREHWTQPQPRYKLCTPTDFKSRLGLGVMQLNVRSLLPKPDLVKILIKSTDIPVLSETKGIHHRQSAIKRIQCLSLWPS